MFDFKITDNGELEYDNGTGLIETSQEDVFIRQLCVCRIKSVTNDWFNENELGANLETFLGQENNEITLKEVTNRIIASISDIVENEKNIFIIPKIEMEMLSFIIFIKGTYSKTPIIINVKIDIVSGVTISNDIDS